MSEISTSEAELGTVVLGLEGGRLVSEYVSALYAINRLYDSLLTLDRFIEELQAQAGRPEQFRPFGLRPLLDRDWLPEPAVLPSERLVLSAIEVSSPGSISLFGDLGILEQLRIWLNDRDERRKDRDYRDREDARRLDLENQQRETDLLRSRIAAMREAGMPEVAIVEATRALIGEPLEAVERAQDRVGLGELGIGTEDEETE
ncbi:MAG: hypothetical protein R8F63_09055 [Acidimicrobiales bacterium]|nr:hypothetical protein [Acidimicrobiales bacterium]